MFSQEFTIKNPTGLHARPASKLAALCKGLPDDIRLVTEKGAVNPKNVIGILTAGLKKGTTVTIEVEGSSEQESGQKILELLNSFEE